jgi:hypothetical protein
MTEKGAKRGSPILPSEGKGGTQMILVAGLAFIALFGAFVIAPTQIQKWHERRAEVNEG